MTEVMTQRGLGLSAPSSRQDVVSALLNDYGNSFGNDDTLPSAYSPVPAFKELPPPPPPRADSLRNKPLPAVQKMNMKFQLRLHEEAPSSPEGSPDSPGRRRIVMRSLSRGAKPPSLKLTISNGSTATIPPTPALPAPLQYVNSLASPGEKDLPPPPPEKSIRRKSVKQVAQKQQKSATDLARNDSLLSPNETKAAPQVPSKISDAPPIVKRKAVPTSAAKKFTSLAELGNGPRGGKGGPMPRTSAQRKESVDSQASEVPQSDSSRTSEETIKPEVKEQAPPPNQLPPTPPNEKAGLPPAPPRKVFTGVGLPSNPRAKGPASPLHIRGKSSTGFNLLQAHRPAPPIPTMNVDTITPEMTPSPKYKPNASVRDLDSPLPPLPPSSDLRRPFSFEARTEARIEPQQNMDEQQQQQQQRQQQPERPDSAMAAAQQQPPPPSKSLAQVILPLRTTSLDSPSNSPLTAPAATALPATALPATAPPAQQSPGLLNSPPPSLPASPTFPIQSPSTGPFTPLTRHSIPLPTALLPAITASHLNCYTAHKHNIWSNNHFQPMACMVCRSTDKDKKWMCAWCQLRICGACSEELGMIPGRDLKVLVEAKEKEKETDKVKEGSKKVMEGENVGSKKEEGEHVGSKKEKIETPGIVVSDVDEEKGVWSMRMGWVKKYKEHFKK